MQLETFEKKPLGGADLKVIMKTLMSEGQKGADELLEKQIKEIKTLGVKLPSDHVVLMLGGSNGILRAVTLQLLFGEKIPVYGVHYDRANLQIGYNHVESIKKEAAKQNVDSRWWNIDATDPKAIEEVVNTIKEKYSVVHLINGIAAGATKRYEEHGTIKVKDIDLSYHPVYQYPDFFIFYNFKKFGMVDVAVANEGDIERTNKFMGTSTTLWVEPLAKAGLIKKDVSIVAFADYDFEKDDPVYGMGPLAGAKILQRKSMSDAKNNFGVKAVRLCYPAMDTTAIGAIPGGLLMLAMTSVVLNEKGKFKNLHTLAEETMQIFKPDYNKEELRTDDDFQKMLPEFHARVDALKAEDFPKAFESLTKVSMP